MSNESKFFGAIKTFLVKNEPEILMGMGISGLLYSTYAAVKATIKSVHQVEEERLNRGLEKLNKKDIFKLIWKNYLPSAISTIVSVPCIIVGNRVSSKRNAALAAAYSLTETALQEYKDKTRELVGEKKEQQIQDAASASLVKKTYSDNSVVFTGDGDSLFFEPLSGRYFRSNWTKVQKAVNELNSDAISGTDYITLSDWFEKLGLDSTDISDSMGWSTNNGKNNLLDVNLGCCLTPNDEPCACLSYRVPPISISNKYF